MKRRCARIAVVIVSVVALVISILLIIQKKPRNLDPERVALVDVVGNNYVFRGSYPMQKKDGKNIIAYEQLTASFNSVLAAKGLPQLDDYYLINFSLLSVNEFYLAKIEEEFFAQHPNLGKVINVSLVRPGLLIKQLPEIPYLTSMIIDIYNAGITRLAKQIRHLASAIQSKPVVVYIHCYAGRDRTGMLVSSYKLLFDKESALVDLRLENIREAGRHTKNLYDRAIASYCLYLNENYHKSLHCQ